MLRILASLVLVVAICPSAFAGDAPGLKLQQTGGITTSVDGQMIRIDFQKPVSVKDLIKTMAQASGKNVVLGKDAGDAQVAISFPEALPRAEAYEKIVAALEGQGLKVAEQGQVVRISR